MKPVTVLDRCSVHYMLFIFLFNAFLFPCCSARDTITIDSPVAGKDTLVSAGERYVLGFLSPASTSYIGIWHRLDPSIVVWVANRDKAFTYTGGAVLAIENGNLSVTDAEGMSYWSRGPGSSVSPNITAQLLDSGNLVLREAKEGTRTILWQSFTEPTDTFLPGMNMDENLQLVSWKDTNDPTPGYFTFKTGEEGKGYVIQIHSDPYWMSNGFFPSDDKISVVLSHPPFNSSQILRNISIFPGKYNTDQRLVLNSSGEIQNWSWDDKSLWTLNAKEPKDFCSVYNACGNNSICKMNWDSTPSCACLEGFMPVSIENWESGSVASGCTAKQFACQNHIFRNYTKVRVGKPDLNKPVENEAVCSNECDCHCQAYSYEAPIKQFAETNQQSGNPDSGGTCWLWRGGLINFQEEYRGGCNLSVRVTVSDKGRGPSSLEPKSSSGSLEPKLNVVSRRSNHLTLTIFMTVISVSVFSCAAIVYIWRRYVRKPEDVAIQRNPMIHRFDSERHAKDLIETSEFNDEDKRGIDVPFFEFESIVSATDNFSNANKLGQGGYGPVYKGMFPGGQELAVKRLSSVSRQGLQEFKNEVVLIAKLQHRNLVKLWGYCVKGDEKILIYEYMPNRSLDAFIFGSTLPALDWEMRYNIILGIARGLLYLHQDSRLRIIHRDMKTSNILLDGEMNPKISDFGLARIVGGKQNEANTNRVVGTYGYMAPEYALEGLFSVKSDVFSFGVVMLEIICGKRNTGFYGSQEALSLLGYCWRFWEEDDVWKLMDQTLGPSCNRIEFVKCAHIGLLCVQEEAKDRPDMETVIMMIGSESATLPRPKQPAFIERAGPSSSGIDSSSVGTGSNTHTCCDLTNTSVEGR